MFAVSACVCIWKVVLKNRLQPFTLPKTFSAWRFMFIYVFIRCRQPTAEIGHTSSLPFPYHRINKRGTAFFLYFKFFISTSGSYSPFVHLPAVSSWACELISNDLRDISDGSQNFVGHDFRNICLSTHCGFIIRPIHYYKS